MQFNTISVRSLSESRGSTKEIEKKMTTKFKGFLIYQDRSKQEINNAATLVTKGVVHYAKEIFQNIQNAAFENKTELTIDTSNFIHVIENALLPHFRFNNKFRHKIFLSLRDYMGKRWGTRPTSKGTERLRFDWDKSYFHIYGKYYMPKSKRLLNDVIIYFNSCRRKKSFDMTLIVYSRRFEVHRLFLRMNKKFDEILKHNEDDFLDLTEIFKQLSKAEFGSEIEISVESFEIFLNDFYGDFFFPDDATDINRIQEVAILAKFFDIEELRFACERALVSRCNIDNLLKLNTIAAFCEFKYLFITTRLILPTLLNQMNNKRKQDQKEINFIQALAVFNLPDQPNLVRNVE